MANLQHSYHNNAMTTETLSPSQPRTARSKPAPTRHVLVALWWWDQRMLEGIARYAASQGWILDMRVRFANRIPIRRTYDGALVFSGRGKVLLGVARAIHGPVVNLDQHRPITGAHGVYCDDVGVGRTAADHLIDCGIDRALFLQVRARRSRSEMARFRGFRQRLKEVGIAAAPTSIRNLPVAVKKLPRPFGIMAGNDEAAVEAIGVCRQLGYSVPDEVAVVGVDNFPTTCLYAPVQLSSVDLNLEMWGQRAAEALHALMDGTMEAGFQIIPNSGVVMRASTDVAHRLNPGVSKALRFIRANFRRPMRITELVKHVGLSRQTLQNYFRAQLGCSMMDQLGQVRLRCAMELMRRESFSLSRVAIESGFRDYQHFHRVFRNRMKCTPSQWRAEHASMPPPRMVATT